MAARTTRSRLAQHSRPVGELYAAGVAWEGLRASWFASSGNWEASEDCIGRQQFFERELKFIDTELNS